jgi:hypothetical protein
MAHTPRRHAGCSRLVSRAGLRPLPRRRLATRRTSACAPTDAILCGGAWDGGTRPTPSETARLRTRGVPPGAWSASEAAAFSEGRRRRLKDGSRAVPIVGWRRGPRARPCWRPRSRTAICVALASSRSGRPRPLKPRAAREAAIVAALKQRRAAARCRFRPMSMIRRPPAAAVAIGRITRRRRHRVVMAPSGGPSGCSASMLEAGKASGLKKLRRSASSAAAVDRRFRHYAHRRAHREHLGGGSGAPALRLHAGGDDVTAARRYRQDWRHHPSGIGWCATVARLPETGVQVLGRSRCRPPACGCRAHRREGSSDGRAPSPRRRTRWRRVDGTVPG